MFIYTNSDPHNIPTSPQGLLLPHVGPRKGSCGMAPLGNVCLTSCAVVGTMMDGWGRLDHRYPTDIQPGDRWWMDRSVRSHYPAWSSLVLQGLAASVKCLQCLHPFQGSKSEGWSRKGKFSYGEISQDIPQRRCLNYAFAWFKGFGFVRKRATPCTLDGWS